ncbi:hypothetical protein CYL18_09595 [Pradoshia eiseniae]|uniref:Uncharacterized protein n=1 Tax=Pradoshia eiseniae TaxID=2064768 RepID=A0A2S7N0H9_9BACI|nr:hypothetical protein CYL18_09595 [Pradoshia eiseniae]
MLAPVLLLILASGSFGVMLHSVYVLGQGGVYPSKRIVMKRLQISGGAFLGAFFLLIVLWII